MRKVTIVVPVYGLPNRSELVVIVVEALDTARIDTLSPAGVSLTFFTATLAALTGPPT